MTKKAQKKNRRFLSVPRYRSGQMEMVGLVVIVILISVGLLFLAQLALKEQPEKKVFTSKGLAYSTMSAIMKTTVECHRDGRTLYLPLGNEILRDCAEDPGGFLGKECDGRPVCDFFEETVTNLLAQTLGTWNKQYEFKSQVLSGGEPDTRVGPIPFEGACDNKERDSSGLFPITSSSGLIESTLYICD